MNRNDYVVHSRSIPANQPGELIQLSREAAGWEWMSFYVQASHARNGLGVPHTQDEEVALVLLGGQCRADWGKGKR